MLGRDSMSRKFLLPLFAAAFLAAPATLVLLTGTPVLAGFVDNQTAYRGL